MNYFTRDEMQTHALFHMIWISFGTKLWSYEMNLFMLQLWFYEMSSFVRKLPDLLLKYPLILLTT